MTNLFSNTYKFIRHYYLFATALVALIVALILQIYKQHTAVKLTLEVVSSIEVLPLLWGMYQQFRSGSYGLDLLAATAIVSSVAINQYWAAIVIVLMLTGGEALEDYAGHRAEAELDALLKRAPQTAHLVRGDKVIDIPVTQISIKNKILIKPGETIPVNCVILEGSASIDESALTGESLPQSKRKGMSLLSGSINIDGLITAEALKSAADSEYEQIIKLVKSARKSQAHFVRLADRYSVLFSLTSFAIAGVAWAISGQAIRFVEVLVVATPCPLILATPIAFISGMSRAAKNGVIVKTGSALEKLSLARSVAFDKTGTLTTGEFTISEIVPEKNIKKNELLALAASLESNSNHVLASAMVDRAKKLKLKITKAHNLSEAPGEGITAKVGKSVISIGRLDYLQNLSVSIPVNITKQKPTETVTYIAINNEFAGLITFEDKIRPESKSVIKKLLKLARIQHIVMVTGDHNSKAQFVAKQLGIKEVVAEARPADKIKAVEGLKDRPVVFVGDGVNDAPVLTASDIGIAMGARGSTAASESADVVIMLDDLNKLDQAFWIASNTYKIAQQSMFGGIALSVALMLVFATGRFIPVYGAILQEVVDVIVIFNALRAHGPWQIPKPTRQKLSTISRLN